MKELPFKIPKKELDAIDAQRRQYESGQAKLYSLEEVLEEAFGK